MAMASAPVLPSLLHRADASWQSSHSCSPRFYARGKARNCSSTFVGCKQLRTCEHVGYFWRYGRRMRSTDGAMCGSKFLCGIGRLGTNKVIQAGHGGEFHRRILVRSSAGGIQDVAKQPVIETSADGNDFFDILKQAVKVLLKPLLVGFVIGLLLTQSPAGASAASGGRVGGKAFSSKSYSAPSSKSYSSRGGGGFTFSAPYGPAPSFGGYGGGGYLLAPTVGFHFFDSILVQTVGFVAVVFFLFFSDVDSRRGLFATTEKISVMKLQVGLLGSAKTLQKDLERLADQADTSSSSGLHHVLTETVLAMLRHPDYWISGASLSEVKGSSEAGEEKFNQLSLEERGKFDEETLVNVDKMRRRSFLSKNNVDRFSNEYIVVTLLVAAEGKHVLPTINSSSDLRTSLTKLGSIGASSVQAVEVLWTPQDENDTLTEMELLRDYPLLRSL